MSSLVKNLSYLFITSNIIQCSPLYVGKSAESFKQADLRWFHKLQWALYNMSAVAITLVCLSFWIFVAPSQTAEKNFQPIGFYIHAIGIIIAVLDLLMSAFPVRILHFIYPLLYMLAYGLLNLILHWTGVNSQVYNVLDWEANVGLAAGIIAAFILVLPFIVQCILFGFYCIRFAIHNCLGKEKFSAKTGADNAAFDKTKF